MDLSCGMFMRREALLLGAISEQRPPVSCLFKEPGAQAKDQDASTT